MLLPLFMLAVAFKGLCEGAGVLPDGPLNASVGGTVMFTPTLTPSDGPFTAVFWKFGIKDIVSYDPPESIPHPDYGGRITFFPSTASLELRDLTLDDSGEYVVNILPGFLQGDTRLDIYEPVSSVTVTPHSSDLVEFNNSARLSCSSSGSFPSYVWMNGSSEVTASDRVQLTGGGSNLTVVNVNRYDQGSYRCRVFNPVSDAISDPVIISVSFGPENVKITVSPSQNLYKEGSDISLTCSAESRPPFLQFFWFLDGEQLSGTGPELTLMNIQTTQSGNYSCQAFHNKTLKYETSQPSSITVLQKISGANVTPSNPTIEGKPVNLTCDASGSPTARKWMKDGSDLIPNDNMILSDDNRVLSFNTVNRENNGDYLCNISNPVSSSDANYSMDVIYGPENVRITGKDNVTVSEPIKLTCSANSTPSATFTWMFNRTAIPVNSPEFSKEYAELSHAGIYTCEALNHITDRRSSATFELFVHAGSIQPSGLSAGAIAGIVIACLVIVAAAAGGVYYISRGKKRGQKSSNRNTASAGGGGQQDNAAHGSEDLNYADINFCRNGNKGTVELGLQNASSDYAELQVNNSRPAGTSPPTYDVHMQRANRPAPGVRQNQRS
ncbi:carcinoembryonic antigen-related cell adhesion molecule 1-like isoform X1 [Cololabis saira]|uniref:carcinoembryonic antigen-related cell adhesion molecule 1-like isoform X1 n=1 Tax=Cololabis saira TaxID=129043 RepID=UPI002AD44CA4|nr:carcinoembryonic antigen-related cell adhesion molecule 1-like isoform X1 [Cololabis saira]